jgi:cobalt-zinc-cadmium resistance protein CzcA
MTLRDLAEFDVKNRLLAVPGVAAVERLGGYLRQFQVQLDPERMSARRVSLDDVLHAVDESNMNASGGVIAQGPIEWTVRAIGRVKTIDDLRNTVVIVRGERRRGPRRRRRHSRGRPPCVAASRIVWRAKW